ncbi:glucans biosynthesis glucosyltransferase MdoH [Methylocapsa acidiphila]|uniref:glucans biosynthesis glucosyltransferase MdoH n=1 Tax=Methylocapsa acidiphila TaxID=133552 RepID=UPI000A03202D|nr:glucans biosynthesis glucosyltransferase MdoH [Methylocapsa acidiphila]
MTDSAQNESAVTKFRPLDQTSDAIDRNACTPPEAPLAMPPQSLNRCSPAERRQGTARRREIGAWVARLFVFGGAFALTAYGAHEMYEVVAVGGVTPLEWALVFLFVANFSWIALAFTSAIAGFVWSLFFAPKPPALPSALRERTAIVMPIYNEAPARVFAALQAMIEEVQATGLGAAFEWFFLSDSTDPEIFIAEERAYLAMRERLGQDCRLYYRHRPKNVGRKSGNIQDFITRWGGRYAHMVVLDADSTMTGHAIVTLAATMEADPDAGIIQTLPLIVNRNTLFARIQQFAARIYGPVIGAGVASWMGRAGNYWGHNAIIRTRAFAAHCGLPSLRGRPPFGGHILSHDFVEAAFMLRAGYDVYMLPALGGSFEESPPSLIDLSARDRRWCQGNLQHLRVLSAKGFHLASRQHFATGIMAYVASPLWMLQLFVGIALVLQASYIRPEYFTSEFTLFPTWPRFDAARSLSLFALTMTILLLPKIFGLALALIQTKTRRGGGGAFRLIVSTLFEIVMSALLAPIMMLIQSGHVMHFVFGFDTGWDPQRRDDGSIPFGAIVRRHRAHVALGFLSLIAGLSISPSLVAWMSPTILGLILAIFLSWATGLLAVGLAFRRLGLLMTPEERNEPPVVARANVLARELAETEALKSDEELYAIAADAQFWAAHVAWLPRNLRRRDGNISAEWALAEAKIAEAETLGEALSWLHPKERMAILLDRRLIERLSRLPRERPLAAVSLAGA